MTKTFTIARDTLLQRVRLTLAYNADRNPAISDRYADVVMTTADEELANEYWVKALAWVASALKRFGCDVLVDDSGTSRGITMSDLSTNSLAAKTSILEDVITSAVEYKIVSDWLAIVGDQATFERYGMRAQGYVEEALELCLRRVRPQRRAR